MSDESPVCPPSRNSYVKMKPEDLLLQIALDGIIVDEEKASQGNCQCAQIKSGDSICWSPGVIGALSKEQQNTLCKPEKTKVKPISPKLESRYQQFSEASKQCEIGKTINGVKIEDLVDRIRCMSQLAGGQ